MPGRSCGACTLCCTVMNVAMDPPKPEFEPCRHCDRHGCAIYEARPTPCREFKCVWLGTQDMPDVRLPYALRPDRTGVVLELNSAGYLIAHCDRPSAWRRQPMRDWLLRMAGRTRVLLEAGDGAQLLNDDGATEALQKVGVDASTNERLYRRAAVVELETTR